MKLSEIKEILNAEFLVGEEHMNQTVFGGGGADLMDDILSAVAKGVRTPDGSQFGAGDPDRQDRRSGCGRICQRKKPKDSILELARSYDLPILITHYSMFVASGRLYMNGLRGLDGSW